jgi:predicted ATP-dependent serine protease
MAITTEGSDTTEKKKNYWECQACSIKQEEPSARCASCGKARYRIPDWRKGGGDWKNEPKCEENAHGRKLKQGEARENQIHHQKGNSTLQKRGGDGKRNLNLKRMHHDEI